MTLVDIGRYVKTTGKILTDGFLSLITTGFDDERALGSHLSEIMKREHFAGVWQGTCDQFHSSMNEEVFIEAIASNIGLVYLNSQTAGTDVAKYIDRLRDCVSMQPLCYVRPLSNTNGGTMLLDHYDQVLDIAERYCGRDMLLATGAYNIDCIAGDEEESQMVGSQKTALPGLLMIARKGYVTTFRQYPAHPRGAERSVFAPGSQLAKLTYATIEAEALV
jgi:hypothetical protein